MAKILETLEGVTNDGEAVIAGELPYLARFTVEGTRPLLFHRWSNEDVEEKSKAQKGSSVKKTDNLEAYIYRDDHGHLSIPSEYFRQALIGAARFIADPRSTGRKMAVDLFKAALSVEGELCTLGTDEWDYLDRRRVIIQRSAVTRTRPAMWTGWRVEVGIKVGLPQYISPQMLNTAMQQAGAFVGVGDFRPSYGLFNVVHFEVLAA